MALPFALALALVNGSSILSIYYLILSFLPLHHHQAQGASSTVEPSFRFRVATMPFALSVAIHTTRRRRVWDPGIHNTTRRRRVWDPGIAIEVNDHHQALIVSSLRNCLWSVNKSSFRVKVATMELLDHVALALGESRSIERVFNTSHSQANRICVFRSLFHYFHPSLSRPTVPNI